MMALHGIHLDHGYIMDMEVMKPITPVIVITAALQFFIPKSLWLYKPGYLFW
ncbi:MAG: hypothetical protein CM15mP90_1890 [Actinomycetota bacterium]|nr:MAG: hypothetical protein CM15mP90_1890 [Actinomycetota bacterium]